MSSLNNAGTLLVEIDLVIVMVVQTVSLRMVTAKREGIEMLLQEVAIGMEAAEGQHALMREATGTGQVRMTVPGVEDALLPLTAIRCSEYVH